MTKSIFTQQSTFFAICLLAETATDFFEPLNRLGMGSDFIAHAILNTFKLLKFF